jgi:hypothetical protein
MDPEEARESGRAFGKEIGQRTVEDMTRAGLTPDQLPMIGAEGIAAIIARADTLASSGLGREIVAAWAERAADAFHSELESAAWLLTADLQPGAKHWRSRKGWLPPRAGSGLSRPLLEVPEARGRMPMPSLLCTRRLAGTMG